MRIQWLHNIYEKTRAVVRSSQPMGLGLMTPALNVRWKAVKNYGAQGAWYLGAGVKRNAKTNEKLTTLPPTTLPQCQRWCVCGYHIEDTSN